MARFYKRWLKIAEEIAHNPEHSVNTLAQKFGVSRQAMSQTLKSMKKHGLIVESKRNYDLASNLEEIRNKYFDNQD